jgi:hypothetical protein
MSSNGTPSGEVSVTDALGYAEFEIDVERVLRNELPGVFEQIAVAPLSEEAISSVPQGAKGAYVLYEAGKPVYAGKTDVRHGFGNRLNRHRNTIQHRVGFDHVAIGFKAVRIMVFSNFDVEAILIDEIQRQDPSALAWNNSGFGSNDPGRNRDRQKPAAFDIERPLNIDRPLEFIGAGESSVFDVLLNLKSELPYTFRYETDPKRNYRVGHAEQRNTRVTIPSDSLSLRDLLKIILAALPVGWRATVFPGRVILYKEDATYPHSLETLQR